MEAVITLSIIAIAAAGYTGYQIGVTRGNRKVTAAVNKLDAESDKLDAAVKNNQPKPKGTK